MSASAVTDDDFSHSRAKSLANLRPWQPGVSANPGGRKNPLKEVQHLCRDRSLKSARALADIAEDPNEDSARRIVAADKVLTWAFGKPPDYNPNEDEARELSSLAPAQRLQHVLGILRDILGPQIEGQATNKDAAP